MDVRFEETPFFFHCEGEQLLGILTAPPAPYAAGVLIVVGGPQYRIGSHRQFVHLARHLAREGIASMRFDYRGMGDSSGAMRTFEDVGQDVRAAVDAFFAQAPWLRTVALWGLCDAASAICLYARSDPRVSGAVLVNPWVRTAAGQARTQLRHYYTARVMDPAFWRKAMRGEIRARETISSLWSSVRTVFESAMITRAVDGAGNSKATRPLPERMAVALTGFAGRTLVILSGNDYTAREFADSWESSSIWTEALRRARLEKLPDADHTFSTHASKERVAELTAGWIREKGREEYVSGGTRFDAVDRERSVALKVDHDRD